MLDARGGKKNGSRVSSIQNPQATENSIQQELFLRFYANDFDPDTQKKILQAIETYPIS